LFGYYANEVLDFNINLLMPSSDCENHDGYTTSYLATGERRIIDLRRVVSGRRKDGSVFPVELSISEVRSQGRRLFTGFVRDLTEQQAQQA
jgi:two-component system sensor kinase FixL